jgi:hypothetical protein
MVAVVISVALLLSACAVGRNHTADTALERNFIEHQIEIEALLTEVQADSRLATLQPRTLIYAGRGLSVNEANVGALEKLGMPRERWYQYQREMQGLGIISIIKGERGTEFRVDSGSILNGDSYKGYWYAPVAPFNVRASLDGYRKSDDDKDRLGNWGVCKPLKKNWYLYLYANR